MILPGCIPLEDTSARTDRIGATSSRRVCMGAKLPRSCGTFTLPLIFGKLGFHKSTYDPCLWFLNNLRTHLFPISSGSSEQPRLFVVGLIFVSKQQQRYHPCILLGMAGAVISDVVGTSIRNDFETVYRDYLYRFIIPKITLDVVNHSGDFLEHRPTRKLCSWLLRVPYFTQSCTPHYPVPTPQLFVFFAVSSLL